MLLSVKSARQVQFPTASAPPPKLGLWVFHPARSPNGPFPLTR